MAKPSIYIETSVISYLTSRPTKNLIVLAHQKLTRDWRKKDLKKFEPFISPTVLEEIRRGDERASKMRQSSVSHFGILELTPGVTDLAAAYFKGIGLPEKARADSYHIAFASWHGMEFMVSWNCVHIAGGRVRRLIEAINEDFGISTPVICTPEELMEV